MNRERATEIARAAAKAKPQSYYAEPFEPHEWVVDAVMLGVVDATADLIAARDRQAELEAELAGIKAALPGTLALEFIRTGLQMAMMMARPVEDGGPENYMVARVVWDGDLRGVSFGSLELAFVRRGCRGPDEMRRAAEIDLRLARNALVEAMPWLLAAAQVDEVVEDEEDRVALREATRVAKAVLAQPAPRVPAPVDPTDGEVERLAEKLYDAAHPATKADGEPDFSHPRWYNAPPLAKAEYTAVARAAFAMGARSV